MIQKLGHFKVLEEVGLGGLGRVYRARDTVHGRTVLIKLAPEELTAPGTRRERFLAAARDAARLSHPNIATLFDIHDAEDSLFLVFEYVPGETLESVMASGPMHVRTALDVAIQLADVLAETHAHEITHGDLRPDTVKITPKGNTKLLDVGLSAWTDGGRLRHPAAIMAASDHTAALESAAYFSPEQAIGEPFDHRTDLFSLGVLLYEMLARHSPFRKSTADATLTAVLNETPLEPSQRNADVPAELDAVVMRALAKPVEDRHQSAASLAAELRGVAAMVDVRSGDRDPPALVEMSAPRRQRNPMLVSTLLATLALVLGGGWWLAGDRIGQFAGGLLGSPPPPIVAVVPLEVDEADLRYLADGFAEDLMARLGQIPGLTAVGRSGMRARRGLELGAVVQELGPGAVLRGSVRTREDRIELDMELIDTTDGRALWRDRRSSATTAVFATQTEIAEAVAGALDVRLRPNLARTRKKANTVSEGTYDLYLRGLDAAARGDLRHAVELYERAIREGEGFAELYAALAQALYAQVRSGAEVDERGRLAEVASLATAADPDLAEAQVAKGMAAGTRGEALAFYRRAVELDGSYALAYRMIERELDDVETELAERFGQRAVELDPTLATVESLDSTAMVASRSRVGGPLGNAERQLLESLLTGSGGEAEATSQS